MLTHHQSKPTKQPSGTVPMGPHLKTKRSTARVQFAVGGGFILIIAFMWLIGLTRVLSFVRLDSPDLSFSEGKLMTVVVIAVALPVMYLMRWLLLRLDRREDLVSICAWCKKVDNDGEWLDREDYFERRFHTRTTHSICGPCSHDFNSELSARAAER